MLDRLVDRVSGEVSEAVHRRAAHRLPVLARGLLEAGIDRWRTHGWPRFDDLEVSCTVQLYRWMQEARRADKALSLIDVSIEHIVLTPDMLEGRASPKAAKRPDLRLDAGSRGLSIECKRLQTATSWYQDYVDKGMARFVSSAYGAGESLGVMVGYLQSVTADVCIQPINQFIVAHAAMGGDHQLSDDQTASYGTWYESEHARPGDTTIRLSHVWVHIN